nr:right-handed parallel beta-helix repeat-containing protein [Motilibacter aurantiacus]
MRADGSDLDGATVAGPLTVTVLDEDVESVTWTMDGTYLEKDTSAPYELTVDPDPGEHELRARVEAGGNRSRREVSFTVSADGSTGAAPGASAGSAPAAAPSAAAGVPPAPKARRVVQVSTADELRDALSSARPGDRIELADGTYVGDPQFEAPADGTASAPITLHGSRAAVLTTGSTDNGGYGLHVTGSYWRLDGFTVRTAKKGIVLDGSVGSVLVGLDVGRIGQEAVHFRSGSSRGVIANSDVHDTGLKSPQFGEGVYVGSATSNWGEYGSDGGPDRSDSVLIQGNRIWNTAAEGIDIKEGTRNGRIVGNRFERAGTSGENSADSWVDVKGSGWLVEGNTGTGTLLDAFQTHVINGAPGSGEDNTFRANKVLGGVKGYVVAVSPEPDAHGNVVTCDNVAGPGGRGVSNIDCSG